MAVLCIPTLSPAGAERTTALIAQAVAGTVQPRRFFVVNNGGHFKSERADVEVYTLGRNIGVAPAWNAALRRFPDELVVFANDDIVLAPDSVERIAAAAMQCRSSAPLICTEGHGFTFFLMYPETVRRFGYFDEGFAPAYYEDTDYLRRMKLAGEEPVRARTGATHPAEQATSRDMGWSAHALMDQQSVRYMSKWGGPPGSEQFAHPWGIDMEVCVPSCRPEGLQRLITSLAWQTVRPTRVTIASNADLSLLDSCGLEVQQVMFESDAYAIGEGDVSLRRNVATWAAKSPYLVYSDDDQVWPQTALEWYARWFARGEHFFVGHHRFVRGLADSWQELRDAPAAVGAPREGKFADATHLWQSCWGGAVAAHSMLIKYGVGGWDMAYPNGEDQQLARRIGGRGDESEVAVHEPPWAWHERDAQHGPPSTWRDPKANVCDRGAHEWSDDGHVVKCSRCPLVRVSPAVRKDWPVVQLYDPTKVRTTVRMWR